MIHPTAIVAPGAKLGKNVSVGPYSSIGDNVILGDNCIVGSHAIITGHTECGNNNHFYQFAVIGEACQDKKYQDEPTKVVIGDNNIFREFCTVHRGTMQDAGVTKIGSNNLFMAYTHIAHDAVIGNHVTFSNSATVAGHVTVMDWAVLSAKTSVHQFGRIGESAFVGGHAGAIQDVPPYVVVMGVPAKPVAINIEGLKRRGFSPEELLQAKRAYKTLYRKKLRLEEATEIFTREASESRPSKLMADFIKGTQRGIVR